MKIEKSGIVNNTITESISQNLLTGTRYSRENPYILTGSESDIIATTNNYTQITPGKTYYLLCSSDKDWGPMHATNGQAEGLGKGTIWLYLLKTYDPSNYSYDLPVNFLSTNMVSKGVWKYTIPEGYNMARVRLNTYSDGTTPVTVKFWDIALIPEEFYTGPGAAADIKFYNNFIVAQNFYEI